MVFESASAGLSKPTVLQAQALKPVSKFTSAPFPQGGREGQDVFFGQSPKRPSRQWLWMMPLLAALGLPACQEVHADDNAPQPPVQTMIPEEKNPSSNQEQTELSAEPPQPRADLATLFTKNIPTIHNARCEDDGVRPAKASEGLQGLAQTSAEQVALADYLRPRTAAIEVEGTSRGTGWICQSDGLIITNDHVVEPALYIENSTIKVTVGERTYDAKIVMTDKEADVAVLKIEPDEPLPTLQLSDIPPEQGELMAVMGNPLGLSQILSLGTISGTDQYFKKYNLPALITAAPLNQGNSGGPGIKLNGDVAGMALAVWNLPVSEEGLAVSVNNTGFMVESRHIQRLLERLQQGQSLERLSLGIEINSPEGIKAFVENVQTKIPLIIPSILRAYKNLEDYPAEDARVVITQIYPGTLAEKSGKLEPGDVVRTIDGTPVTSENQFVGEVKQRFEDEPVTLELIRQGKAITVTLNDGQE